MNGNVGHFGGHLGDLITAYVDGELDDDDRLGADAHLAECEHCRVAVAHERSIASLLQALPDVEPPAGFYEQMLKGPTRLGLAYPAHPKRRWRIAAANVAAVAAVWLVVVALWQGASTTVTPSTAKLVDSHRSTASLAGAAPVMTPVVEEMADDIGVPASLGHDFVLFDVGDDTAGEWKKVARYSDGTNQVSLFRARADVRWSDLSTGDFQTVDGDRAWRGVIDSFEVLVVQRGGYAYALVGEDQAAVDAAVELLPTAKEPSLVDRMRDAARGMVDAFSLKG